jgi:hypothetical protein
VGLVVKKKRVEGNEGMVKRRRAKRKRTRGEEVDWKKLKRDAAIRNYSLTIAVNMIMSCQDGVLEEGGTVNTNPVPQEKVSKKQRKKGRQE